MDSHDIDWFVPVAAITALELFLSRSLGTVALLPAYFVLISATASIFAFSMVIQRIWRLYRTRDQQPIAELGRAVWRGRGRALFLVGGLLLAILSGCAVTALKARITTAVPFYADPALASIDRMIFGEDSWLWANAWFGWAHVPVVAAYESWMLGQLAAYMALMFAAPSRLKSQSLLAFVLMWLILGLLLAYLLSSAGPIFYDRIYGGTEFSGLQALLQRSPLTAASEQYLWQSHQTGDLQFAAGISAMPSLHVAGATWLALVLSSAFPRLKSVAIAYVALIYIGSLMTGWHYALDGIVGVAGVLAIWKLAGMLANWRCHWSFAPAQAVSKY